MSKKLKIIAAKEISAGLNNLLGKDLNIVFNNDSVLFGQIKKVSSEIIIFRDKRNKKHKINLKDIQEIIIDEPVDA